MIYSCRSAALHGIEAQRVTIETSVAAGMSAFTIVGFPDTRVQEARERIRCAIKHSGVAFPYNQRITCNLAPANVRKEGTGFDVAIAMTLVAAVTKLALPPHILFVGELGLDGSVRPVRGVVAAIKMAHEQNDAAIIIPAENTAEAECAASLLPVYTAKNLAEIIAFVRGLQKLPQITSIPNSQRTAPLVDLKNIFGNESPKRALEIAAAGHHHLLMCGPPGTGKTMLAQALTGILPRLNVSQQIATMQMYSATNIPRALSDEPPLRAPHHSSTSHALIGGGTPVRPGEITLAHHGVLFLDELPEFNRHVRELLRQPLETGRISVARAGETYQFPAQFQLVAAYNPCPCGYAGDPVHHCRCTAADVLRYEKKISGPLLDRVDLFVTVPRQELMIKRGAPENSEQVQQRVVQAQKFATTHAPLTHIYHVPEHLTGAAQQLLTTAATRLALSPRALLRTARVARTVADLSFEMSVTECHVAEALQFRAPSLA